jgi:PAS domain S-box-containing protein
MNITSIEQYQELVEYSTDSITLMDEDGVIQFKSQSVRGVLGYSPDDLVGENAFEYVHPEDRERAIAAFENVADSPSGTTGKVEYRFRLPDDSWLWVESTFVNRTDTVLDGYVLNTRDISERKQRERELAEESEKYSTVVEQSNDGIVIVQDGDIAFVNERFEELSGYEKRDLVGEPFTTVITPEDRELVERRYEQRLDPDAEPPPSRYEIRVLTNGGERRIVELSVAVVQYGDGPATLTTIRDVTDQKRYEERLEELTEELELLNRVVRHDIRNDMSIILAWGQLLEDHVDEEGQEHLKKILSSGEHVVELTKIARDYVETLTSDTDIELKPMSLSAVLETELALRRESFPETEFVVRDDIPDVEVIANEMLGSVFRNLLVNAVSHNDSDTPVVEVTVEEHDEEVVVQVADNGPGIPDDRKETVFGKGEKGLDSPSTGIGLYLVHTLVTQYGGDIHIEDNDPRGAVFSVHLPLAE